jgi:hypothetical protein
MRDQTVIVVKPARTLQTPPFDLRDGEFGYYLFLHLLLDLDPYFSAAFKNAYTVTSPTAPCTKIPFIRSPKYDSSIYSRIPVTLHPQHYSGLLYETGDESDRQ